MICPYCEREAELVTGQVVYPHRPDLHGKRFYACMPCGAWVGTHRDGRPLGTLANRELRAARQQCHVEFDPIWRVGRLRRHEAYQRLASMMGIEDRQCHIGMFTIEQCRAALPAIRRLAGNRG